MSKPKLRHVAIKTDDVHKEAAFWSDAFDLDQGFVAQQTLDDDGADDRRRVAEDRTP